MCEEAEAGQLEPFDVGGVVCVGWHHGARTAVQHHCLISTSHASRSLAARVTAQGIIGAGSARTLVC